MAAEAVVVDGEVLVTQIYVDRIVDILSQSLTPKEIGQWMKANHPALSCSPAQALQEGRVGDVIALANRFIDALREL